MNNSNSGPPLCLVYGNHASSRGIEEILFAIHRCLSREFSVQFSPSFKRDRINIVIDEFASPYVGNILRTLKKQHPRTQVVLVATEFVTPVVLFGHEVARTFNFFGEARELIDLLRSAARVLIGRRPVYMLQRYKGFANILDIVDLLVVLHPEIEKGLADLRNCLQTHAVPPLMLYPEIDLRIATKGDRLSIAPFGFTITGTVTSFRAMMARNLIKTFELAGCNNLPYAHRKFEESSPISDERTLLSIYDVPGSQLFNFNPPQRRKWPYSSPMRIARAAMLGQIPVVTSKFGDHELEGIATLWDGKVETAAELLRLAFSGRDELIDSYTASVTAYNEVATRKNAKLIEAIRRLRN
jgi:hypothetical protein